MALSALWDPNIQFLKTDGTINAGGKILVTDHNDAESIPANYSDADGTTLNSSPIVLDALGRATCYIDDANSYDIYVKDADGTTLWTVSGTVGLITPSSDASNLHVMFTKNASDTSAMMSGKKLANLFTAISNFFASLKALAFKDKVSASDVESGTYGIDISGNAATADTATTADSATSATTATSATNADAARKLTATSFGYSAIDLDTYTEGVKAYFCNAANASNISNKPSGVTGAFALIVITQTGVLAVQQVYDRDSEATYTRRKTGLGSWTSWVKLVNSTDTIANATTAALLGSASVGLKCMPIYLAGGAPQSISGYFFEPMGDPSVTTLNADKTLNAVGGGKYVYNVSTSNTFTITLASSATVPISFAVRVKVTANCPTVAFSFADAMEKTTTTRTFYLTSGKALDLCFTYYAGYFHLVSVVDSYT